MSDEADAIAAEAHKRHREHADRAERKKEAKARQKRGGSRNAPPKTNGVGNVSASSITGVTTDATAGISAGATTEATIPLGEATAWPWIDPTKIPRRQWLYGTHVIRGFVSVLIAPGGSGKSSLTIAEIIEMVTGKALLTDKERKPLRVWYYNLEDPADEVNRRIAAACIAYKMTEEDIGGRLFVDSGRDRPLVLAKADRRGNAEFDERVFEWLISEIKARKIDVLVIDPTKRAHRLAENDNTAMDALVEQLGRVAHKTDNAIGLVHHSKKMGGAEITTESSRGGSAFTDAVRVARTLNVMTKDEAEKADVPEKDRRRHFRVYSDKMNMAPPPDASEWYRLESVYLPNGPEGAMGDNVGVCMPWDWPDAFAGLTAASLLAVQRRIDGEQWRRAPQAANWVGKAVAEVLHFDLDRDPDKAKVRKLINTWIKSGALKVVEHEDDQRRPREFVEVGEWAT